MRLRLETLVKRDTGGVLPDFHAMHNTSWQER